METSAAVRGAPVAASGGSGVRRPDDAAIDAAHREAFGSYAVYFQLYLFLIYLFFKFIENP